MPFLAVASKTQNRLLSGHFPYLKDIFENIKLIIVSLWTRRAQTCKSSLSLLKQFFFFVLFNCHGFYVQQSLMV